MFERKTIATITGEIYSETNNKGTRYGMRLLTDGQVFAMTGAFFDDADKLKKFAQRSLVDPTFFQELNYAHSNNNYLRNKLVETAAKIDAMEMLIQEFNEFQIEQRTKREKQRDREFELECRYDESKEDVPGLPEAV